MRFYRLRRAVLGAWYDIQHNHMMALAAGLAYYFTLSLFPLLIFLAAALAYVPIPNLFDEILNLLARVAPAEAMGLIRQVAASVLTEQRPDLVSFGFIATIWFASGGFVAMIEALNVAYDVPEGRPLLKMYGLAVAFTFIVGALIAVTLVAMSLGPNFGAWLAERLRGDMVFAVVWPWVRWGVVLAATVLAVELLYFLGPNVKQKFRCTLPGAVIAVSGWVASSWALGVYIQNFGNYDKTYGTIGAVIVLMLWLYVSSLFILAGAEINSELLKAAGERLPKKEEPDPQELEDPREQIDREAAAEGEQAA